MAIRMMVGKERAGLPNVETVHNFPGAESKYISHHWKCPHKDSRLDTERHSDCHDTCRHREPLYMETSFVGAVLSCRERNGYDDSDFFALVWDDIKSEAYEIEYGTTRAWTYPNNATVDATPETIAKYNAWLREVWFNLAKQDDIKASKQPIRGRVCRVVSGRKIAKETTVEVLRVYEDCYMGRKTQKAVVKFALNGCYTQVHTATSNLEVIDPSLYLTPDETLRETAHNNADQRIEYMFKQ